MKKRTQESEPSTSGKRSRCEDFEPELEEDAGDSQALSLEEDLTFSDTLMALQMMRTQFPRIEKVSIQPFILQSQLYSTLKDRTQVDRELEIDVLVKRIDEKKQSDLHIFDSFKTHVLQLKLDTSISHDELCSFLSLGGKVKDEDISQLTSAGILIRRLINPNTYWFSIPNIGTVLKGLCQGRNELLSLIKRRKYKEILLSVLEKRRLRFSSLDMRFHLRDLIGSGHLKVVPTPIGLVVRVATD